MANLQVMLVDISGNYRLIMEQSTGDIQSTDDEKHPFVIPGRRQRNDGRGSSFRGVASGPRQARPAATNPESSDWLWIPGSLAQRQN
jgi:hypothetical protein